jgi:hypothetical protein
LHRQIYRLSILASEDSIPSMVDIRLLFVYLVHIAQEAAIRKGYLKS